MQSELDNFQLQTFYYHSFMCGKYSMIYFNKVYGLIIHWFRFPYCFYLFYFFIINNNDIISIKEIKGFRIIPGIQLFITKREGV